MAPNHSRSASYASVSGGSVLALKDWSSLWFDLVHADMLLHARASLPASAATAFQRRGLFEAAIVGCGRTVKNGSRQQTKLVLMVDDLGADAQQTYADALQWRDKHIAHRVDQSREQVHTTAVIVAGAISSIQITVAPTMGPEDEGTDFADRFATHVKTLRDLVWPKYIKPLEGDVIREQSPDIDDLCRRSSASPPATGPGLTATMNP